MKRAREEHAKDRAKEFPEDQELSDMGFLCPITQELFIEPVVASDGHTYDVKIH